MNKHFFLFPHDFDSYSRHFYDFFASNRLRAGFLYNTAKMKSPAQIPNSKYAKIKRNEKQDECR